MSKENVEIVRHVYEGWSRGDFSQSELVQRGHRVRDGGLAAPGQVACRRGDARAVARQFDCVVVRLALYWDTERAREAAAGRGLAERLPAHRPHLRRTLELERGRPGQ